MEAEKIKRINELAKKQKTSGLTTEESAEQAELRKAYLQEFRASFRNQLDHTVIQRPDGSVTPLSEMRKKEGQ